MDNRGPMPTRSNSRWARIRSAWYGFLGRRVPTSSDGTSDETASYELEGTESVAENLTANVIVSCPQPGCGSPAFVSDLGVSMPGVGFCGHDWVFKMVKIRCVEGHSLDALDEENSVHGPESCEKSGIN